MTIKDYFPELETYWLAPTLLTETLRILREEGQGRGESLIFWAGRLREPEADVHTIIVPKGNGVELHPTHVYIGYEAMRRVAEFIAPPGIVLLAQVHTHGGLPFHSPVDDFYGFRSPGFVSAVVGDYGVGAHASMETWAVFECVEGARFRQLPTTEVRQRFRPHSELALSILEANGA